MSQTNSNVTGLLPENTLTLIRHGKGGLGAPGRCGRDTCPGEREEARRGAWIWLIRSNQPIRVLREEAQRGIWIWPIRNNQPIPTPSSVLLFLLYTHTNHQRINHFTLYFQVGAA